MNVDDVTEFKILVGKEEEIFEKQSLLKEKYHAIEERNGIGYALVKGIPFHLDDRRWQYLMKDMAWRSVEEIAEAYSALMENLSQNKKACCTHVKEEVADSLHFLVELLIVAGIRPVDVEDTWVQFWSCPVQFGREEAMANYIESLGMAMNHLKQKPWKQTHFMTDEVRFIASLIGAFRRWLYLAYSFDLNEPSVYSLYFKKSEVNSFRQRSQY